MSENVDVLEGAADFFAHPRSPAGSRVTPARWGASRWQEGRLPDAMTFPAGGRATPGSPQLNSFGPNMSFAKDLLERSETCQSCV